MKEVVGEVEEVVEQETRGVEVEEEVVAAGAEGAGGGDFGRG